jgi:hypothetical protein
LPRAAGYPWSTRHRVASERCNEALALGPVAWLLFRWRAGRRPDRFVVGAYLILAGSIRFAIEFVRINEHVLGVLTVAHLASLAAVLLGVVLLALCNVCPNVAEERLRLRPDEFDDHHHQQDHQEHADHRTQDHSAAHPRRTHSAVHDLHPSISSIAFTAPRLRRGAYSSRRRTQSPLTSSA